MDWIQTALHEYKQIASLCNAQSTLSNTILSSSSSPTSTFGIHDDDNLDPKKLSAQLQQQSLHEQLANYYKEIDAVRKTHSSLKKKLISIQENDNKTCQDSINNNIPNEQTSTKIEAFSNHIQLSERVIRTVMMQTSTECGVLYANGLVRATSADQHEINIVALAALRASVSQLKEKFEDE